MESAENLPNSKEFPPCQERDRKEELVPVSAAIMAECKVVASIREPATAVVDHKLKGVEGKGEMSKEASQTREETESKMEPGMNQEHTTDFVQKGETLCFCHTCTCVCVCVCVLLEPSASQLSKAAVAWLECGLHYAAIN